MATERVSDIFCAKHKKVVANEAKPANVTPVTPEKNAKRFSRDKGWRRSA